MSRSQKQLHTVGRLEELAQVRACLQAGKNVLLEGPVGVGKTHLALEVISERKSPVFRVDGDQRYSEQKLSGWFDPPQVIKKGFHRDSFVAGPLVEAMLQGGVLFINELNRLPEGVQNVLLPAIDERMIIVPRLGEIRAKPGFLVIATQNPKEFVATTHLSEAILDRFELVILDYQSEAEEVAIVLDRLKEVGKSDDFKMIAHASVKLTRLTRNHPRVRRGASIRAALSIAEITYALLSLGQCGFKDAFLKSVCMALPTRIEIERDSESELSHRTEVEKLLEEWVSEVLKEVNGASLKKKT
jgi:gas vesicle protein GvpN